MWLIIIMGVSGSGKTSLAKSLSLELNIPYYDADDFHNEQNISKMKEGIALNDSDREPWLNEINMHLREKLNMHNCILACSALKEAYRNQLVQGIRQYKLIHLKGSYELILERVNNRKGHFMKAELLKSQFDAFEEPMEALDIPVSWTMEEQLRLAAEEIKSIVL